MGCSTWQLVGSRDPGRRQHRAAVVQRAAEQLALWSRLQRLQHGGMNTEQAQQLVDGRLLGLSWWHATQLCSSRVGGYIVGSQEWQDTCSSKAA